MKEVLGSEVGSCSIIYGGDHRRPNQQENLNIDLKEVGNEPERYPRDEQWDRVVKCKDSGADASLVSLRNRGKTVQLGKIE